MSVEEMKARLEAIPGEIAAVQAEQRVVRGLIEQAKHDRDDAVKVQGELVIARQDALAHGQDTKEIDRRRKEADKTLADFGDLHEGLNRRLSAIDGRIEHLSSTQRDLRERIGAAEFEALIPEHRRLTTELAKLTQRMIELPGGRGVMVMHITDHLTTWGEDGRGTMPAWVKGQGLHVSLR